MNINYTSWKSNALKLFALTLVFLFAIQNSQGQTGTSCADPIDLNPNMPANGNGSYSFYLDNTSGSKFYSFTATENGTAEMSSCLDFSNTDSRQDLCV